MAKSVSLNGGAHAHACTACRERYEDPCKTADVDALCASCAGGSPVSFTRLNRMPQPCCRVKSQSATSELRQQYRLGGAGPWWICLSCKRTHPYDPKERSA